MLGFIINPLTPNDLCISRTAPLTSKRCILYISLTNVGTEYFKHSLYSPFFFSSKCSLFHNAHFFVSCIIHILYTGCPEIKKNNSGAKGLIIYWNFISFLNTPNSGSNIVKFPNYCLWNFFVGKKHTLALKFHKIILLLRDTSYTLFHSRLWWTLLLVLRENWQRHIAIRIN